LFVRGAGRWRASGTPPIVSDRRRWGMLRGWIICDQEDETMLPELGIVGGIRVDVGHGSIEYCQCEISENDLGKLDVHWGRFVWYFEEAKKDA